MKDKKICPRPGSQNFAWPEKVEVLMNDLEIILKTQNNESVFILSEF